MHQPPGIRQAAVAVASFLVLAFIGFTLLRAKSLQAALATKSTSPAVTIDHTKPIQVTIAVGNLGSKSVVDVQNKGSETIGVTVPASWKQREVRLGTVADVLSKPASPAHTRWTIPKGTIISFEADTPLAGMHVLNPSRIALHIAYRQLNLQTDAAHEDDVLLSGTAATFPL
ncbi:MAG: hypothetical protein JWM56_941 [Candidatus Peribacteria bacterium]|nr:hypothetical protein [Candidatus Peribacteria bacterium]